MNKTVADIMVDAPIVVEVPGSRYDAINIMVRKRLTGLPVIRSSDGRLMGIVSRRDLFRKPDEDQLSLIMKKECITVTPDCSIQDAARIFVEKRIHRIPVVDNGMLVGIVTPTDLLKIVRDMKTQMIAEDIIGTTCVTAYEEDPLTYIVPAMRISDVSALPVLDANGNLKGIITDRDLFDDQMEEPEDLEALGITDTSDLAGYRNVLPLFYAATDRYAEGRTVKDFMVKDPLTVFKKTNVADIAKMMIVNDFGQIPVHGTKDELVGMVYDVDVLKALTRD